MNEKRNLTQYEKILLASAYNLKNYCYTKSCDDCIFSLGSTICLLTDPNNPCWWELDKVNSKFVEVNAEKEGETL